LINNADKVGLLANSLLLITSQLPDKKWEDLWTWKMKVSSVTFCKRHMYRFYMENFCAYKQCNSINTQSNIWHLSNNSTNIQIQIAKLQYNCFILGSDAMQYD
jgi:hypothetical protein